MWQQKEVHVRAHTHRAHTTRCTYNMSESKLDRSSYSDLPIMTTPQIAYSYFIISLKKSSWKFHTFQISIKVQNLMILQWIALSLQKFVRPPYCIFHDNKLKGTKMGNLQLHDINLKLHELQYWCLQLNQETDTQQQLITFKRKVRCTLCNLVNLFCFECAYCRYKPTVAKILLTVFSSYLYTLHKKV